MRVNRSCRSWDKCEVRKEPWIRVCKARTNKQCTVQWRFFTRILSNTLSNIRGFGLGFAELLVENTDRCTSLSLNFFLPLDVTEQFVCGRSLPLPSWRLHTHPFYLSTMKQMQGHTHDTTLGPTYATRVFFCAQTRFMLSAAG